MRVQEIEKLPTVDAPWIVAGQPSMVIAGLENTVIL